MKAVILSAGQGKRLLPLTADSPKCILPIMGQTLIEWQIDELAKSGIERVTVVLGYRADKVQRILQARYGTDRVRTVYNPAYAVSDNLVSCWAAHDEMDEDFILLNGDTLFEAAVLNQLLGSENRPVTVVVSQKNEYDDDDMKVELDGRRLVKIGKDLIPDQVDGESIGMIRFRGQGPKMFRDSIETALHDPLSRSKFYLAVIDNMARRMPVWTCLIQGLQWCEIDYRADLKHAENVVMACSAVSHPGMQDETCQVTEISLANP